MDLFYEKDGSNFEKIENVEIIEVTEYAENKIFKYGAFLFLIFLMLLPQKIFSFIPYAKEGILILKIIVFVLLFKTLDRLLFNEVEFRIRKEGNEFTLKRIYFPGFFKRKYFIAYAAYMFFFFLLIVFYPLWGIVFLAGAVTAFLLLKNLNESKTRNILKVLFVLEIISYLAAAGFVFYYDSSTAYMFVDVITLLVIITFMLYVLHTAYIEYSDKIWMRLENKNLLYFFIKEDLKKKIKDIE